MDCSTDIDWFALPSPVWYKILSSLSVSDVVTFSASSNNAYTLTLDDLGVWKQRCIDAGFREMLNAPVPSYYMLFKRFLYRYGSLIGKWRTDINGIGAILLITLDGPRVVASSVQPSTTTAADNESYKLRPFFEVVFADDGSVKIHCKHFSVDWTSHDRDAASSSDCTGGCAHAAALEWGVAGGSSNGVCKDGCGAGCGSTEKEDGEQQHEDGGKFTYCCHQGCRHDLQELHTRLVTAADTNGSAARRRSAHLMQSARYLCARSPSQPRVTFSRFSPPSTTTHPLAGLWRGGYGDAGIELITLHPTPLVQHHQPLIKLTAHKATGDVNVPAGQVSFWFQLPAHLGDTIVHDPEPSTQQPFLLPVPTTRGGRVEVDVQACIGGEVPHWEVARGRGKGVVALPGFSSPEWVDVEVVVYNANSFGVWWPSMDYLQLFSRLVLG